MYIHAYTIYAYKYAIGHPPASLRQEGPVPRPDPRPGPQGAGLPQGRSGRIMTFIHSVY